MNKYKTPSLTVDIFIYNNKKEFILIKRKNEPFKGQWALPGGFVDYGETVENAVIREMKEETSLDITIESLLGVYSDPKRDERFHTVSVVYVCKAYGNPIAQDDAKEVYVYNLDEIPFEKLVFDHKKIILDFLENRAE